MEIYVKKILWFICFSDFQSWLYHIYWLYHIAASDTATDDVTN